MDIQEKEETVLLKMCQMLQVLDSETCQTELTAQFFFSTFKKIIDAFSFFFLHSKMFVYEADVISCNLIAS